MPQVDTHELFASTPAHAVFAVTVVSPSSLCHYRIVPKTNRCPNSQLSRYIDAWQRVYVSHAEVCRSGPLFHQPCGVPFPYNLPRETRNPNWFSRIQMRRAHMPAVEATGGASMRVMAEILIHQRVIWSNLLFAFSLPSYVVVSWSQP